MHLSQTREIGTRAMKNELMGYPQIRTVLLPSPPAKTGVPPGKDWSPSPQAGLGYPSSQDLGMPAEKTWNQGLEKEPGTDVKPQGVDRQAPVKTVPSPSF